MRKLPCIALLAISGAALATPLAVDHRVAMTPIVIAPSLQAKLQQEYGAAEGLILQGDVSHQLSRVLAACGTNTASIEVAIEDAAPTHPTRKQIADHPSVDALRSVYLGGARLSATLRGADGAVLTRVAHSYYPDTLKRASASGYAWADARLAIGQFADKLAEVCHRLP